MGPTNRGVIVAQKDIHPKVMEVVKAELLAASL